MVCKSFHAELLCQARNRHNLEQSSRLAQNKELLNKRNAQVTVMDQRIGDLRERLHKKKAEVQDFIVITAFIFWHLRRLRSRLFTAEKK